jgi:broad-specificity NMP kinase
LNVSKELLIGGHLSYYCDCFAYDKFLRDVQKREETLMNERSALNIAKKEGIQQGVLQRNAELAERLRSLGYSDEKIKEILG